MGSTGNFSMNTARLCIDRYAGDISGRVYSKLWREPLLFSGIGEMLLGMDRRFDECGYPQAFQERRSFIENADSGERAPRGRPRKEKSRDEPDRRGVRQMPAQYLDDKEMQRQCGAHSTFDIVVQSRRRTGWQGILMHPDRKSAVHFNSEMELLGQIYRELGDGSKQEPLTG